MEFELIKIGGKIVKQYQKKELIKQQSEKQKQNCTTCLKYKLELCERKCIYI